MTPRPFLASLLVATALSTGAVAQDAYDPDVREIDAIYYVTWLEATVRESPSSTASALAPIAMGDRINVTGIVEGTDWLRIGLEDGTVGYVWNGVLAPATVVGGQGEEAADPAVASADAPPDGVGNSIYEARVLGPLDQTEMTIDEYVGDTDFDDYYEFELSEWSLVDLALQNLTADADLVLTDEYEFAIGSSEGAGSVSEFVQQVVPPGRYFVRVTAFEGNTDYTLTLYAEPADPPPPDTVGNSMEEATPIAAPGEVQSFEERVDLSDHEDWYSFTVEEVTEVTVSLSGLQGDIDLELAGDTGYSIQLGENSGSDDELISAVIAPGTYFIRVFLYSGQSDYRLEVSGMPSDATPSPTGDPAEHAIDLGALDPTDPEGLRAQDRVGPTEPDDHFSFTVDAPTALEARLEARGGDLDLELLDSRGVLVTLSNNSGNADETILATVEPGTYYLHVYAFDGSSDYTLSVVATPQP